MTRYKEYKGKRMPLYLKRTGKQETAQLDEYYFPYGQTYDRSEMKLTSYWPLL